MLKTDPNSDTWFLQQFSSAKVTGIIEARYGSIRLTSENKRLPWLM